MPKNFQEIMEEVIENIESDLCVCLAGFAERALFYQTEFMRARKFLVDEPEKRKLEWEGLAFQVALNDPAIWATLAKLFDAFVLKATWKSMMDDASEVTDIKAYISHVKEKVDDVEKFKQQYPLLKHTLEITARNFTNNIAKCCKRISHDWENLELIFGKKFLHLKKIRCSGNDFHKGGAQVQFLTFACEVSPDIKLVYKPSDLELDFWIIGNTQNLRLRQLMELNESENSFLEIINRELISDDNLDQPKLPTYTIYPAARASKLVSTSVKEAIQESYGYSQFLEYSDNGLIQDEEERNTYYHLLGRLLAISRCLSIHDFHQENLIVHAKKPCLIDLEASFMAEHIGFSATCAGMALQKHTSTTKFYTLKQRKNNRCKLTLSENKSNTLNVLRESGGTPIDFKGYIKHIFYGYVSTLYLIRSISGSNKLNTIINPWIERASKCLARHVPMRTEDYYYTFRHIYDFENFDHKIEAMQRQYFDLKRQFRLIKTKWAKLHAEKKSNRISYHAFRVYLTNLHKYHDFWNLDIPSFYGFPSNRNLFDARGGMIIFPDGIVEPTPPFSYFEKAPIRYIKGQFNIGNLDRWIKTANIDITKILPKYDEEIETTLGNIDLRKS